MLATGFIHLPDEPAGVRVAPRPVRDSPRHLATSGAGGLCYVREKPNPRAGAKPPAPPDGHMPETTDIFDAVIGILQRQKAQGRRTVDLTPETREHLFPKVAPSRRRGEGADPRGMRRVRSAVARATAGRQGRATAAAPPQPVAGAPPAQPVADVAGLGWGPLEQHVAGCHRCALHESRTRTVFGEGNLNAQLMFVGEGPGFEEDMQGRPFVGPAGQLLTRMIAAMQFAREDVYIANVVKCHPPGNRNPREPEARTCLPYLNRQIDLVRPEVLVLLGAVPLFFILGKTGIRRLHGAWHEYRGVPTLPTFHPAYLLRSPEMKADAWRDLQEVMRRLERDPSRTPRRGHGGP